MCLPSAPKAPTPPPTPEPVQATEAPVKDLAPEVKAARTNTRRKAALAGGRKSTIVTGASGLTTPASTAKKTLLGG